MYTVKYCNVWVTSREIYSHSSRYLTIATIFCNIMTGGRYGYCIIMELKSAPRLVSRYKPRRPSEAQIGCLHIYMLCYLHLRGEGSFKTTYLEKIKIAFLLWREIAGIVEYSWSVFKNFINWIFMIYIKVLLKQNRFSI